MSAARCVGRGALLLFVALVICGAMAEFTAKDMHSLKRLGDFAVSSSGKIVYTVSKWDPQTNVSTSSLYLAGKDAQVTVPGLHHDNSPAFSPTDNDSVFFLSDMNGATNVFTTSLTGPTPGTVNVLTSFPIDVSNLKVTPNYIAFTAEIYTECGVNFQCTADKNTWHANNPNTGMTFDQLFVRHWDVVVIPNKISVLFTQQIRRTANGYQTLGAVNMISYNPNMKEMVNTPVPPDGGPEQIDIAPNYGRIAYTADIIQHDTAWTTGWVIYESLVDSSSGAPWVIHCLTCGTFNRARTTNPKYSPDSLQLAFLAMDRPGFEADRLHLELFDLRTSSHMPIATQWDRSISDHAWTADGASLLVTVDEDGEHPMYSVNIAQQTVRRVLTGGSFSHPVVTPSNLVVYSFASWSSPSNLQSFQWDATSRLPSTASPVTQLNPGLPSSFDPGTKFYFRSEDGSQVQGWFFKPAGWQPGVSYPFTLLIHGGPQGAWTSGWSYRWNPQLWAQRGYAVAAINPHGSSGFGQKFCDAVSHNWGGIPYRDLMTGVQQILANYTWIHPNRMGACGASYGGYMINWIAGNAPNRFAALVSHDGLFDIPSSYGSTDELWFAEWEFGRQPWNNPEGYQQWNPANHVENWKAPMLVIHGGHDYRIDLSQGLGVFTSLQRRGIPSRFLYYPLENHWVTKPTNSIQWYTEVLGWLDRYTFFAGTKVDES